MKRTRGFTLVELLVVIAIIALLISLLLPALGKAIRNGKSLKDGTQTKEIHRAMLSFASANKGRFPTPGLINRLPDPNFGGTNQINSGPEDNTLNHTRHFYSAMIAQDLLPTMVLIGPTEVQRRIVNYENYNFNAYNPGNDSYWDPNFNANIQQVLTVDIHTSYTHMTMVGKRKRDKFRETGNSGDPVIGNRAPLIPNGETILTPNQQAYQRSPTLRLHDPKKIWTGNVCFNDNHTERLDSFYAALTSFEIDVAGSLASIQKDAIFSCEFPGTGTEGNQAQSDAFLSISVSAASNGLSCAVRTDPEDT
jgi:prepilin-type N-terminal cleavage/methylation domain-containing protein